MMSATVLMRTGIAIVLAVFVHVQDARAQDASPKYTQLVQSSPYPPLVGPENTQRLEVRTGIFRLWVVAAKWFNQDAVNRKFETAYDAELKKGLKTAADLGQRGVLLKKQILVSDTPAYGVKQYDLVGDGVALIGVGNSANDVCFASKCYEYIEPEKPAGAKLTEDSGYIWVEPTEDGKAYNVSQYRIDLMHDRTRQIYLNEQIRESYKQAIAADALTRYADKLARTVQKASDRDAISSLIQNRQATLASLRKVEDELAEKLRKAERASKASNTLSKVMNALSLASAIAMASTYVGEDVVAAAGGTPITTQDQLLNAVKAIEQEGRKSIQGLMLREETLRNELTGVSLRVFEMGVVYGMKPEEAVSLKPL